MKAIIVELNPECLLPMMNEGNLSYNMCIEGLPKDAKLYDAYFDRCDINYPRRLKLIITSETFKDIKEWEKLPIKNIILNGISMKDIKDNFMKQLETDYSEKSDKPLLKPQNAREYWLFTEIWQRCTDFFNKLGG